MSVLLNLSERHLAFMHYQQIEKVCKMLFHQTYVKYFAYQRWYANGFYTFLPSAPDLGHYFYKEGGYQHNWFSTTRFDLIKKGVFLWDVAKPLNFQHEEVGRTIATRCKLVHGIEIIEKNEKFCEIYSFSSDNPFIYHTPMIFLRKFILYFKQECFELIQQAHKEKFYLPYETNVGKIWPILDFEHNNNHQQEFPIKKFYLSGPYENIYLTRQEVACLKQLAGIGNAQKAAQLMGIGARTFETHLANIKLKLGCTQSLEALMIGLDNYIY